MLYMWCSAAWCTYNCSALRSSSSRGTGMSCRAFKTVQSRVKAICPASVVTLAVVSRLLLLVGPEHFLSKGRDGISAGNTWQSYMLFAYDSSYIQFVLNSCVTRVRMCPYAHMCVCVSFQCRNRRDYVEVLGGHGFGENAMIPFLTACRSIARPQGMLA